MDGNRAHSFRNVHEQPFPLSHSCGIGNFWSVVSAAQNHLLHPWCLLICPWCTGWRVYSPPRIYVQPSLNFLHCLLTCYPVILPLSCTSINWQWVLLVETYFTDKTKSHYLCDHRTMLPSSLAFAHQLYPWITSDWPLCHLSYVIPTKNVTSYWKIKCLIKIAGWGMLILTH